LLNSLTSWWRMTSWCRMTSWWLMMFSSTGSAVDWYINKLVTSQQRNCQRFCYSLNSFHHLMPNCLCGLVVASLRNRVFPLLYFAFVIMDILFAHYKLSGSKSGWLSKRCIYRVLHNWIVFIWITKCADAWN